LLNFCLCFGLLSSPIAFQLFSAFSPAFSPATESPGDSEVFKLDLDWTPVGKEKVSPVKNRKVSRFLDNDSDDDVGKASQVRISPF
jgi:hypothetical protein